jgi:hypothetical protein
MHDSILHIPLIDYILQLSIFLVFENKKYTSNRTSLSGVS